MGFKYETETWAWEIGDWVNAYQGQSLFAAIRSLIQERKAHPGRAYRLVIR